MHSEGMLLGEFLLPVQSPDISWAHGQGAVCGPEHARSILWAWF